MDKEDSEGNVMKIILATRNPSKAVQIKAMFADLAITVATLTEAGIEGEAVEDGETLEANALKKARYAHRTGCWSMADDTGLFIDALDGRPGIHAARWAGETATTDEITQYTLGQLEGALDRTATFKTVVALMTPAGDTLLFSGAVKGTLLDAPRTQPQPKMPYSPLFIPDGSEKVWAEMTLEEENAISHRGQAFQQVCQYLSGQL
jgi:XTP/dITP diphosphohydrolase